MTRQRDLSGFGIKPTETTVEARPLVTERTTVPAPPRRSASSPSPAERAGSSTTPTRSKKAAKQRITLSLPTQVAMMLRATADTEQRIFLDVILSAFVSHADDVENELLAERSRVGPTGSRRRAGSGRTQIPLNILKEDLKVLDQRVNGLNMDRSAYVTELLIRELKR